MSTWPKVFKVQGLGLVVLISSLVNVNLAESVYGLEPTVENPVFVSLACFFVRCATNQSRSCALANIYVPRVLGLYIYLEATSHGQIVELCVPKSLALTLNRTHGRHPLLNLPQLEKLIEAQNLCSLPYVIQIKFEDVVAGEHVEIKLDDYEVPPRE
jgi:hypothetical protein